MSFLRACSKATQTSRLVDRQTRADQRQLLTITTLQWILLDITMSGNRATRIRITENGKLVKTIPNATINYSLHYDLFKKMIGLAIRLSPQDPLYEVEQIMFNVKDKEGEDFSLDSEGAIEKIKKIASRYTSVLNSPSSADTLTLTVS